MTFNEKSSFRSNLKITLAIVCGLILGNIFTGNGNKATNESSTYNSAQQIRAERESKAQQAYIACRAYLRQNAQSTIELSGILDYRFEYSLDSDEYYIYSWIEGQNGFGAPVRQEYKCTTSWDRAANRWVNIEFEMLN